MRHRKAKTKMGGRTGAHRRAMYSNMLAALVEHGRIETTERKARGLRQIAERAIARATSLGDVLVKDGEDLTPEERARLVHVIRTIQRTLRSREATLKLVGDWAPRYLERPGGYTRMFKLGRRRGDAAPMASVEFIPDALPGEQGSDGGDQPRRKGPLSFLRRGAD